MTHSELSIYSVAPEKKVEGFDLVEDFFLSDGSNSVEYNNLHSKSRGIFQALCILIDDGCLKDANAFIDAHPAILKVPFVTRKVGYNEDGVLETMEGYNTFSPLLLIAPYLIRKGAVSSTVLRGRIVYKQYSSSKDIEELYSRDELLDTVNSWFSLGLDPIIRERADSVLCSVMDLGVDNEFASAYMDIILKLSLQSPVYVKQYCEDAFLNMVERYASSLSNLSSLVDKELLGELRYTALCLNTYVKHNGEMLFDIEKVKSGDIGEIEQRLSTYMTINNEIRTGFMYVVEILYILLRGIDTLSDAVVIDIFSMKLMMEIYDINPIEALNLCKTDEQRELMLKIIQGE